MNYYTVEKNVQMIIYLLRKYNIKRIIASPGTTNITFVYSCQQDSFFEVYSAPDERSAAYMACGMSVELNEPVVISCTGATASRNYLPGLTEAYYRNIPILAVTSTQPRDRVGNLFPQFIDRCCVPRDAIKESFYLPSIHCKEDELNAEVIINRALIELTSGNGGPVHVNLETEYRTDYSYKELPSTRIIRIVDNFETIPSISLNSKIGIYVGAHRKWYKELTDEVDRFCECYNAVVLCDQTSNYNGKYRIFASLLTYQERQDGWRDFDLLIDIGDVSGAYMRLNPKEVWRINIEGRLEDRFRRLTHVFKMKEEDFFRCYVRGRKSGECTLFDQMHNDYFRLLKSIEDIPFSNIYSAYRIHKNLPDNIVMHFGILNSLRSWNFFEPITSVLGYSNTGGFGIDGGLSTCIGASIVGKDKLYFCIIGDLAFFYDMNALGNRHVGNNLRLMVIQNGCGTEFKNYDHIAHRFGNETDSFIAARGHYGNKSVTLLRDYAKALGFEYLCAHNKEQFDENMKSFLNPEITDKSIVLEVFTDSEDESRALKIIKTLNGNPVRRKRHQCKVDNRHRLIELPLNDEIEFECIYEGSNYIWQYQYPGETMWKNFVDGNKKSIRRVLASNYDDLRVHVVFKDKNGKDMTSGEVTVVLE